MKIIAKLLPFCLFFIVSISHAAIVVTQNVPLDTTNSAITAKTVSITVSSGDNFLAVSSVGHCTTVSATYNGVSMYLSKTGQPIAGGAYVSIYYLANPDVGTHNLVVTQSSCTYGYMSIGASLFSGVDVSYGTSYYANGGSDTSSPFNVPFVASSSNSMIWFGGYNNSGATLTAAADWNVGQQPEVLAFGSWYGYSDETSNTNPYYSDYTSPSGQVGLYGLQLKAATSGGGGGVTIPIGTYINPATLYTSQLIQNPSASSTYYFTATNATSTGKQAGLVYITHTSTTTPVITWNGISMTALLDTDAISNFITTLYTISNPTNGIIAISGIATSSIKYISQSVWNNATVRSPTDIYTVNTGSNIAYVQLPSLYTPATLVTSMYTVSGLDGYNVHTGSTVLQSATSTTGEFSLIRSTCISTLDTCGVGYIKPFTLFDTRNGVLNGIVMYATSSISTVASSSIYASYAGSCNPLGEFNISECIGYLFIPSTDDMLNISTSIKADVLTKFPLGYFTDIYTILSTTTIGTLTVIDATLPSALGLGSNQNIHLDLTGVLDPILNATTSSFNNSSASSTETFYLITSRYWNYLLNIGIVIYLLIRIFGNKIIPSFNHDKIH